MKNIFNFKKFALALVFVLVISSFASCGGSKNYDGITLDIGAFAEHIYANGKFDDELIKLEFAAYSFGDGTEFVNFGGTGATPEEIIVVDAKSADGAQAALVKLNERLADQKTTFSKYNADQKPKLNDAVVMTAGNYAIYAVSADNAAMEDTITAYLDAQN